MCEPRLLAKILRALEEDDEDEDPLEALEQLAKRKDKREKMRRTLIFQERGKGQRPILPEDKPDGPITLLGAG
jgi:hypothetical protein